MFTSYGFSPGSLILEFNSALLQLLLHNAQGRERACPLGLLRDVALELDESRNMLVRLLAIAMIVGQCLTGRRSEPDWRGRSDLAQSPQCVARGGRVAGGRRTPMVMHGPDPAIHKVIRSSLR